MNSRINSYHYTLTRLYNTVINWRYKMNKNNYAYKIYMMFIFGEENKKKHKEMVISTRYEF